jgi:SAM-dependent methyltransferase
MEFFLTRIIFKNRRKKIENLQIILDNFKGKHGLEIGGPSSIFRDDNILPLYSIINGLDGCNFNINTLWEGNISAGLNYNYYKDKIGYQYICDVVNLSPINNDEYDFVLCSHVLEHVANPLKAMAEMLRVLKNNGSLLLVLPDKEKTFDHHREVTDLSHLIDDFNNNIREDDLTHLEETLKFHDLRLDPAAGTYEKFKKRSLDNYNNRALHQHIFDINIIVAMINYFNMELITINKALPFNIIVLAEKTI